MNRISRLDELTKEEREELTTRLAKARMIFASCAGM